MNITNKDYETIERAISLLPDYVSDEETSFIVNEARMVMQKLELKKRNDNKRIAAYIAKKRETNKQYAR